MAALTIGVEEEFHVVDAVTRGPATEGLDDADVEPELHRDMVETTTAVCTTLEEVRAELERLRASAARAAAAAGSRIAAAGTLPLSDWRTAKITATPRYEAIGQLHQQVAREQSTCGLHVHVGIPDRDLAVAVGNHARLWLPALLALSASSPYWSRIDTGYASYRSILWRHWPTTDVPECFSSAAEYDAVTEALVVTGAILDAGQIYYDVRPSAHQATLEFRVADACTTVDEAVLQAALTRALARTCQEQVVRGDPPPPVRTEVIRGAKWRAARYGLEDDLADVVAVRAVPAAGLIASFVDYVRPALEEAGDDAEVAELVGAAFARGTGARRQRRTFARRQRLTDVVDFICAETASIAP
ncbi:MAG TPA: glutamate--cysteine ligase [Egibacteraceae bacterium]|nr:glutamate--cysteine ligase [Egibacteraceae bacterium]